MTFLLPLWVALCGALATRGLDREGRVRWPLALVLGPAVGFGTLSLVYFLCRLVGVSVARFQGLGWLLLVLVTTILLVRAWLQRRPRQSPVRTRGEWLALVLLGAGFALAVIALVLYARQLPHGTFDAWAIWTSRARLLHRGEDLAEIFAVLRKAHPDYPLLVPGSVAAQFALAGSESPLLPQMTGALFMLAAAGGVVLGVRRLSGSRIWAALAGALLLATPNYLYWGSSQCADLPLACLLLLTVVALAALLDDAPPWLGAGTAGFLLGLLGWTKNEGMPLTLILLALFAAAALWTGRRALVVPVLVGALPGWLGSLLFRWLWAPKTDLGYFADDLWLRLAEPGRWSTVGEAFALRLDPVRGFDSWGLVWLAAGLALLVGGLRHRAPAPALRFARWVLLAVWLAWFGVFVGTPLDLTWHLQTALDRLLLQLMPLTLTVAAAGMALAGGQRARGATSRGLAGTLLLAGMALAFSGCRAAGETARLERLIGDPAGTLLADDELMRDETIERWPFALASAATSDAGWRDGPGVAVASARGLELEPGAKGRASLQLRVDLDAAAVDVLRLDLANATGGTLALWWADQQQPFDEARRLQVDLLEFRANPESTVAFVVREHPGWSGRVQRLRLDYTQRGARQPPLELRELRAARRLLVDDSELAAAAHGARRVEVDHERRDALVAAPGSPLTWELSAPATGELHFGYATRGAVPDTILFRVRRDGASAALFEARVGAEGQAAGKWFDVVLPADAVRGARSLSFEVDYPGLARRALAFWSAPRILPSHAATRPDILLVSIDTLRPDHLSLYGAARRTSPELDSWSRSAVVFERVVTTAPWTLPAHLSLFTGRDALSHGVNYRGRVPADLPLLTEALRAAGYATWALTGGGYLDPEFGLDRGFDRFRYWPEHTGEAELAVNLATAFDWLAIPTRQPLFLFFHTYEVHHPYRPRQPYFERFARTREVPSSGALGYVNLPQTAASGFEMSKEWRQSTDAGERLPLDSDQQQLLVDLYDSGVAYTDAQLGRLLARWGAREGADEGVVAVTSDHGEALGEKGLAGHAYVEDFNALVPLVLRLPGGRNPGRVASQVRLTDLAPTLAELARVELAGPLDGRSLLPLAAAGGGDHRPAWLYAGFANRGLALRLNDRWKYVLNDTAWPPLQGREALYDLRRDPTEGHDLATEDPARTAALRELARAEIANAAATVRVSLANHSVNAIVGRLAGTALQVTRVKSPYLPPGALERVNAGLRLEVAPGETRLLLLASPTAAGLAIQLEPSFKAAVDLESLTHPWRAGLDDSGWRVLTGGGDDEIAKYAATLSVEWTGGQAELVSDPTAGDADLRRQLEALGYIE
jgi:arylsulfatase A-like enzyme